jgi:uncharacterized protein YybS (DUF2232 family)
VKNARSITEGALLLAICAVLVLITLYVPVLSIISVWFMPLPFIFIAWKNDWKGIMVFFVAALMISLIVGNIYALPMTLLFGTTGITLGYLVQKNKSRTMILMAATLVFLINLLIIYGIVVTLFQFNFIEKATWILNKAYDSSYEILSAAGQENEAKKLKERIDETVKLLKVLFPSLLVVGSFINVYLLQLINFSVLKRFGIDPSLWKPFRDLFLPKSVLWYYLITAILTLILNPEEGSYLYTALWNLAYILQILLVFQGLSFIFFVSHLKSLPRAIPIVIIVLSLISPLILYIIRILGIIDLGFEMRKRLVKK